MGNWVVLIVVLLAVVAAIGATVFFMQKRESEARNQRLRAVLEASKARAVEQARQDSEKYKKDPTREAYADWRAEMDRRKKAKGNQ